MSIKPTMSQTSIYERFRAAKQQYQNDPKDAGRKSSNFLDYVENADSHTKASVQATGNGDLRGLESAQPMAGGGGNEEGQVVPIEGNSSQSIAQGAGRPEGRQNIYDRKSDGKTAPYSALADENGIIEYNGCVLKCNYDDNSLEVGDCSPGADYLVISLPDSGGCIKVNRANIGDLLKAIDMFSARDRWAIIKAISKDSYCQRIKNEIEDETEDGDALFANEENSNAPGSEDLMADVSRVVEHACETYDSNILTLDDESKKEFQASR